MQIDTRFLPWLIPLVATGLTVGILAALIAFARNAISLWRDLRGKPDPSLTTHSDLSTALDQHSRSCAAVSRKHVDAALANHAAECFRARSAESSATTAEIFGDIKNLTRDTNTKIDRLANSTQKEFASINRAIGRIEGQLKNGNSYNG